MGKYPDYLVETLIDSGDVVRIAEAMRVINQIRESTLTIGDACEYPAGTFFKDESGGTFVTTPSGELAELGWHVGEGWNLRLRPFPDERVGTE